MRWLDIIPSETQKLGNTLMDKAENLRAEGQTIYPPQHQVFNALRSTQPDKLKVCIVGQDPYHEPNQANGMAFSVNPGVPCPPSLNNIFEELHSDLNIPVPTCGDLTPWAEQGVLLLNTSLTVREHCANSHADWGWHNFTKSIFATALQLPQPIVFLLWGRNAQNFVADLDITRYPNKAVLMSTHPSPLAARRSAGNVQPFIGSRPFSKTNQLLIQMGADPVNWQIP